MGHRKDLEGFVRQRTGGGVGIHQMDRDDFLKAKYFLQPFVSLATMRPFNCLFGWLVSQFSKFPVFSRFCIPNELGTMSVEKFGSTMVISRRFSNGQKIGGFYLGDCAPSFFWG